MSRQHLTDLARQTDLLTSALEALEAELYIKKEAAVCGPLWREVSRRMGAIERVRNSAGDEPVVAELL